MALADRLRAAAQRGRQKAQDKAQRLTTVALEVTVYDKAINMDGASVVSTTTTTLTPSPKVELLGPGDPSWFGGGLDSAQGGDLTAKRVRVGPITKAFPGGGYDPATLAVAASATTRVVWRLTGPGYESGGELYDLVAFDRDGPQSTHLILQRTRQ